MSVSRENSTSDNSLWCMYDHLNSGMRNGGLVGPGLNIGRVEYVPDFDRFESDKKVTYFFFVYKKISYDCLFVLCTLLVAAIKGLLFKFNTISSSENVRFQVIAVLWPSVSLK